MKFTSAAFHLINFFLCVYNFFVWLFLMKLIYYLKIIFFLGISGKMFNDKNTKLNRRWTCNLSRVYPTPHTVMDGWMDGRQEKKRKQVT